MKYSDEELLKISRERMISDARKVIDDPSLKLQALQYKLWYIMLSEELSLTDISVDLELSLASILRILIGESEDNPEAQNAIDDYLEKYCPEFDKQN